MDGERNPNDPAVRHWLFHAFANSVSTPLNSVSKWFRNAQLLPTLALPMTRYRFITDVDLLNVGLNADPG